MMATLFVSIFIALLIERFAGDLSHFRQREHIQHYLRWVDQRLSRHALFSGGLGVAVTLLPPVIVLNWAYDFFDGWFFGLLGIVLSIAFLLFSLGPKDIDVELNEYLESDDENQRRKIYTDITGQADMPENQQQREDELIKAAFIESNRRLFGVIFWFIVGGPLAALLFRLTRELALGGSTSSQRMMQASQAWLGLLSWIPARLQVLTMAITGNFDPMWQLLKKHFFSPIDHIYQSNINLLSNAGLTAVELPNQEKNNESNQLEMLGRIISRNLVSWIIVLALLALVSLL